MAEYYVGVGRGFVARFPWPQMKKLRDLSDADMIAAQHAALATALGEIPHPPKPEPPPPKPEPAKTKQAYLKVRRECEAAAAGHVIRPGAHGPPRLSTDPRNVRRHEIADARRLGLDCPRKKWSRPGLPKPERILSMSKQAIYRRRRVAGIKRIPSMTKEAIRSRARRERAAARAAQ
jgi:hypothetical protein